MSGKIILIATAKPDLLAALSSALQEAGHVVKHSRNGAAALDTVGNQHIDLVLLDLELPGPAPLEVCRRLRGRLDLPAVPIIAIADRGSPDERTEAYEAGAHDYLLPSLTASELLARVRVLLDLRPAEEIGRLRDDMLTLFTHETRTPLSLIVNTADLLLREPSLSPEARKLAAIVQRSGARLLEHVRKAVLLCQLKSEPRLFCETAMLQAHLRTALARADEIAADRQLQLILDVPDDLELEADWQLVDDAFTALLENAIQHSPAGGRIFVRATADEENCSIEVADEGQGLTPAWTGRLFEEFTVGDLLHHHRGSGLGLALAHRAVACHGGSITVASEPGRGSTFTLVLPRQPQVSRLIEDEQVAVLVD